MQIQTRDLSIYVTTLKRLTILHICVSKKQLMRIKFVIVQHRPRLLVPLPLLTYSLDVHSMIILRKSDKNTTDCYNAKNTTSQEQTNDRVTFERVFDLCPTKS